MLHHFISDSGIRTAGKIVTDFPSRSGKREKKSKSVNNTSHLYISSDGLVGLHMHSLEMKYDF